MGAQEQGPKGQNGNFQTLSSLDVEVVQPNHSVKKKLLSMLESAYGDPIRTLAGGGGGGLGLVGCNGWTEANIHNSSSLECMVGF